MSIFGASAAQGINGTGKPDPAVARKAEKKSAAAKGKDGATARGEDGVDLTVENATSDGAVRSLKDNRDQETRGDRKQQNGYRPQGRGNKAPKPAIDIQG